MNRYAFVVGAVVAAIACNDDVAGLGPPSDPATETFAASLGVDLSQMTKLESGVYIRDLTVGTGNGVTDKSDTVVVTYSGFLKDGKLFESQTSATFVLADLIPGLRSGLIAMKEGGRRKFVIPSAAAYGGQVRKGADGKTLIPRQATLIFNVDLVRVHTPTPTP